MKLNWGVVALLVWVEKQAMSSEVVGDESGKGRLESNYE